jgi:hypothetical protein
MSSRGYPQTRQIVARRRKEAEVRNAEYNTLTPQQKLELLDRRLGKNIGAEKQRARLQAQIEVKVAPKQEEIVETVEVMEEKPKKIKAKDRRKQESK